MSLVLEHVTRVVDGIHHIDDASLSFEPGSFNVLLGRTLSGKTSLMRALVVLGVFNLLLHLATPPDRMPHWVQDSMFYPLSQASGAVLKVFAPKGKALAGKLAPAIKEAVHEGGDNTSGENSSDKGYDDDQRRKLDDLVEKSR